MEKSESCLNISIKNKSKEEIKSDIRACYKQKTKLKKIRKREERERKRAEK
jgi:hypothetical protein